MRARRVRESVDEWVTSERLISDFNDMVADLSTGCANHDFIIDGLPEQRRPTGDFHEIQSFLASVSSAPTTRNVRSSPVSSSTRIHDNKRALSQFVGCGTASKTSMRLEMNSTLLIRSHEVVFCRKCIRHFRCDRPQPPQPPLD